MQGLEILQYKISPNPNPKSATNPRSPYCVMRFIRWIHLIYVAGAFRNGNLCRITKFSQEVVKNGH